MTERERAVVKAVDEAKAGEFGVTGFKFEFEAFFGRLTNSSEDCYCDEGWLNCGCCEGDGDHFCEDCSGEGVVECTECDGAGEIGVDGQTTECSDCIGGTVECGGCEGSGRYECDECGGSGRVECEDCGGEGIDNPFVSTTYCHDWLLEYLSQHGLAEASETGWTPPPPEGLISLSRRPLAEHWKPKAPIAYSQVYHDATVDTEWTVTLSVESKAKAILYSKILGEAFNALGEAIQKVTGTSTNISNAGMHISVLNSVGAVYPTQGSSSDHARWTNFRKSMVLMMPALYFLAASSDKTRGLQYRAPQVSTSKYNAIHYDGGALEFRVFDTCYQNVEQILDNVVVICNALRYWRTKYKRNYLDSVTKGKVVYFGVERGYSDLKNFFVTSQHIDLLNRGLKLLKPEYYTIRELKVQRGFKVTKRQTNNIGKDWRIRAEKEYKEYERRIGWDMVMTRGNYIRRYAEEHMFNSESAVSEAVLRDIENRAEQTAKREVEAGKLPLDKFVDNKIEEYQQKEVGRWKLAY